MAEISYLDGGQNDQLSSIPLLFYESVEKHPDVEAIIAVHQKPIKLPGISPESGQSRLTWTYKQLKHASDSLAERLSSLGVCKGTSIAIFSRTRAELGLFLWAAVRLGCPFIPLNPATLANANELQYILSVVCPGVVVLESPAMAADFEKNASEEMRHVFLKVSLDELEERYILEERHPVYYQTEGSQPVSLDDDMNEGGLGSQTIGWVHLPDLWPSTPEISTFPKWVPRKSFDDSLMILFTSGTTSFPKACPVSDANFQIYASHLKMRGLHVGWRTLMHAPPHHGFANITSLCNWCNGFTIVYPSATFNVSASLDTAESERCQSMPAVPAMIHAFNLAPEVAQKKLRSVEIIDLGAAPVTPEIVDICQNAWKVAQVVVTWAMTESPSPIANHIRGEITLNKDEFVPVGKPLCGMKAKVCAPSTKVPLKRNEEGELHVAGPQVIRGYVNSESDNFYEDEDARWVITGDMASVGDDGMVRIIGRSKDIIIRGGVNIAPAIIELKLNAVQGVDCQVVGVADEMAGEIPVAVVKLSSPATHDPAGTIASLREIALRELGPKSAPAQYLDLNRDLELDDFPVTFSGKVKKNILRSKAQQHFLKMDKLHRAEGLKGGSTRELVCGIWSQLSGIPPGKLSNATNIFDLVDSITTMRFCSFARKELAKGVSVIDIMKYTTVDTQTRFLDSLPSTNAEVVVPMQERKGPPTAKDITRCSGSDEIVKEIQSLCNPAFTNSGLHWSRDVEDVLTAPDTLSIYLTGARPQTWNHRTIYIARNTSHDQLVAAWKAILFQHPLLRCVAIDYPKDSSKLLVVLRNADAWWNASLSPNLIIDDPEDLHSTFVEWADSTAGPLVRVGFVRIANAPQDSAMVFVGNHGVFDNMSANVVFEDLEVAIEKRLTSQSIPQFSSHVPFKLYADFYHLHRTGGAAKLAADYHVQRIKGIANFAPALWPPSKAPGWFKGDFTGWKKSNGEPGELESRKPLDSGSSLFGLDGLARTVKVSEVDSLREHYGVKPYAIIKAAVALYNIHQTEQPVALFAGLEAARHWPFMPVDSATTHDEEELLKNPPDPLTIAGPMFETVINVIHAADKNEKVLDFLKRIQEDQESLSAQSHAPLREILAELSPDDQLVVNEAIRRQIWNWPPGAQVQSQLENQPTHPEKAAATAQAGASKSSLEEVHRSAYDDVGIAWTCGLRDRESFYLNASYDDCQLGKDEVFIALGKVLSATAWLAAHLDSTIGEISFTYGEVGGLIA